MSNGKPPETTPKPQTIRQQIDEDMKTIHSVARILSTFRQFDRDTVRVDPVALGIVHEMIVGRVLAIYETLEKAESACKRGP